VRRRPSPAATGRFGLVVVDEAHHVSAPGFSTAMWSMCAPYTLALTATPDRIDGLGRVVNWFMGEVAFRARRTQAASTRVRVVAYRSPAYLCPPPTNRRGDVCFPSVVSALVADEDRTRLVVEQAVHLARGGRDVLVLSHRVAHCRRVCELVRAAGVECATYLGGDKSVPSQRVMVATYALTNEGFDCPRLTALVLATPMSNVEQACGRVMRGRAATDVGAVIVDVKDEWGVCFAQHSKRAAFYRRSGFTLSRAPAPAIGIDDDAPATDPATARCMFLA
jgi:superfamily II DNA or RNA helicase